MLEATLQKWGYSTITAVDGSEAWRCLQSEDPPQLVVLDWMMPGLDGLEVCRKVRAGARTPLPYVILVTARESRADVVTGLNAGADDYMSKPFDHEELRARIGVGVRVVKLQQSLAARLVELEQALARVKQLQGLLPICSYCKKIRDDKNYWQQVDAYIAEHSEAQFSHGICPDCFEKFVKPELEGPPAGGEQTP